MIIFIIAIIIIIFIYYIINSFRSLKIKKNVLIAFTGQMGSGKTFHAVKFAIKEYKRRKILKKFRLLKTDKPIILYSNIPILIQKERRLFKKVIIKEEWSTVLEREHILMEKNLNEYSVIFIDEISTFASQWDYNNPNCQITFAHFLRFCRHYIDPAIFITAQSIDEILVDIRRKMSIVYHLDNMRRTMIFFYKVDVIDIKLTEEIKNINAQGLTKDKFFFGILPFKYLKKFNKIFYPFYYNKYDSRCYSENYPALNKDSKNYNWQQYKTSYFIDLIPTYAQVKEYQEAKKGVPQNYIKSYIDTLTKKDYKKLSDVNGKPCEGGGPSDRT